MATLWARKLKGGVIYYVDFMYQGKRCRTSTKTVDSKLAELFLKDIEVKIAKDNFGFDDLEKKKIGLKEFSDKYLDFSKATKAENTYLLDSHSLSVLASFLGDIKLRSIDYRMLVEFKIKRLKKVKPTSVNIEIRHLKAAFETARKWGYLPENPFRDLKQVKIKGNNFPKFLTKMQVRILLEAIPDGEFRKLVQFYLYTGCRRNEALNVKWSSVDKESRRIAIKGTKSGEDRIIPIGSELMKVLDLIENSNGKLFNFSPCYVTHKFKKHLKISGIEDWESFNVHSLRHTFASHLVMEGIDLYVVSKLLDHSSVKITEMYAHLAPDYLKVSVERLKF